jgi:hypothetical protein
MVRVGVSAALHVSLPAFGAPHPELPSRSVAVVPAALSLYASAGKTVVVADDHGVDDPCRKRRHDTCRALRIGDLRGPRP